MRNRARAGTQPPETWPPLVVTTRQQGALRLAAVNTTAASRGLSVGLALAQAEAMCPDLIVRAHDAAADATLLARLADWMDRYTPLVGRTPPDGLMLDITGAAHLAGGERALVDDIADRLAAQGFQARIALAGTPGCAHAVARFSSPGTIVPAGEERAALVPLPVAALRIDTETSAGLTRAGLKRISDLMSRPRAPLAARYGAVLLHRLDQATGVDAESIAPRGPIPPAVVDQPLAEPIVREDDVSTVARTLAERLCLDLEARGEGARALCLSVFRVDGAVRRIEVGVAEACRDPAVLHGLLALRLSNLEDPLDAGYGFDHVRLAAPLTGPWSAETAALTIADMAVQDPARAARRLADRLVARFGKTQVLHVVTADTHVPERAARLMPAHTAVAAAAPPRTTAAPAPAAQSSNDPGIGPRRPLRLFEPPEPVDIIAAVPDGPPLRLRWRRQSLRIAAAEGPERIALPWWNDRRSVGGFDPLPRDYYRVADETGRRLWIFREGLYDQPGLPPGQQATAPTPHDALDSAPPPAPTRPPRWFVHGLFG